MERINNSETMSLTQLTTTIFDLSLTTDDVLFKKMSGLKIIDAQKKKPIRW